MRWEVAVDRMVGKVEGSALLSCQRMSKSAESDIEEGGKGGGKGAGASERVEAWGGMRVRSEGME